MTRKYGANANANIVCVVCSAYECSASVVDIKASTTQRGDVGQGGEPFVVSPFLWGGQSVTLAAFFLSLR